VVEDAIHGAVEFDNAQLDDWILVRTDGTPTYNFCNVVDDVSMKITHVIRGNDHLSNTPKQIQCYVALGYPVPVFAHIPMILGADKSRLSKRHGATSVQAFREAGILPEAMVNYLARLGWSHGDQEIFSREDLIRDFDLGEVGKAGAVFDYTKLEWVSHHWLRHEPSARVAAELAPFLRQLGFPVATDLGWLARVVDTLKERAKTLKEMAEQATFYLKAPQEYDPQATAKFWTPAAVDRYAILIKRLDAQESMEPEALELLYRGLAAELSLKLVDLAQITRIALTGKAASPPIFDVISILGKAETLARLRGAQSRAAARS
jgi:glutamyl-tRNA synthetase